MKNPKILTPPKKKHKKHVHVIFYTMIQLSSALLDSATLGF